MASYHTNRYAAANACEHCEGIIRHEKWCITESKRVRYAFEIIVTPSKLTEGDKLTLNALGVIWDSSGCTGTCKKP